MNSGKIFCIHCGTCNDIKNDICPKCGKKLNEEENLFKDFLTDHIKDDIKGKLQDSVYDTVKGWLLSHLYGCLVTVSLIAVIGTGISAVASRPKKIMQRPEELRRYEAPEENPPEENPPEENPPEEQETNGFDLRKASWDYLKNALETGSLAIAEPFMTLVYCETEIPGAAEAYVIHRTEYTYDETKNESYIGSITFSDGTEVSVWLELVDGDIVTTYKYRDGSSCTVYPDGRIEGELREDIYQ